MKNDPYLFAMYIFFFSIWGFFHKHSRTTGMQGKGEGISLTTHYLFHPLHRHLDISQAITAESSPLHIASRQTRTENLWFAVKSFFSGIADFFTDFIIYFLAIPHLLSKNTYTQFLQNFFYIHSFLEALYI